MKVLFSPSLFITGKPGLERPVADSSVIAPPDIPLAVHRFSIPALKTLLICLLVAAVVPAACYSTPDPAVSAVAINSSVIQTLSAAGVSSGLLNSVFYAFLIRLFRAFASAAIAVVIPVVILPILVIIIVVATIPVVLGAADVGKNAYAEHYR